MIECLAMAAVILVVIRVSRLAVVSQLAVVMLDAATAAAERSDAARLVHGSVVFTKPRCSVVHNVIAVSQLAVASQPVVANQLVAVSQPVVVRQHVSQLAVASQLVDASHPAESKKA